MHGLHVVRMTWPQIIRGYARWFWWRLKKDIADYQRRIDSCQRRKT